MPPDGKAALPDAPLSEGWLLPLPGDHFTLLAIDTDVVEAVSAHGVTARVLLLTAQGNEALRARLLGQAGSAVYLIRPDQHVAARWEHFDPEAVALAKSRAIGRS